MPQDAQIKLVKDSQARPFTPLYEQQDCTVYMLHDGHNLVRNFWAAAPASLPHSYFICNYSQCVTDRSCKGIAAIWNAPIVQYQKFQDFIKSNVLFLMNSKEEYVAFTNAFPHWRCALVNNCFTLSERQFTIAPPQDRIYRAVYNAKPASFKRHTLAEKIEGLALISYAEHRLIGTHQFHDIRPMNAAALFWGIPEPQVAAILNQSHCGLLLSATEGACYASTEYLLCGLPVVSTVSHGGRAEYYTAANSIICEDSAEAVAAAVTTWCALSDRQAIDHAAIRQQAVAQQHAYRQTLAEHLAAMTGMLSASALFTYLTAAIHQQSKLLSTCHYWMGDWMIRID